MSWVNVEISNATTAVWNSGDLDELLKYVDRDAMIRANPSWLDRPDFGRDAVRDTSRRRQ